MKWIVKKETIFVQTVVCIFFLLHSGRVKRWNYEAVKKYIPLHSRNGEGTSPPPPTPLHLTTTHTLFASRWKKNLLS